MVTNEQILNALQKVFDPELGRNIVELGMVRDLAVTESGEIGFMLALTIPGCPMKSQMERDARMTLLALPGVKEVAISFGAMSEEEKKTIFSKGKPELPKLNKFNRVEKVIVVMSGKGGVGKSSLTAMLACALIRSGRKIGILDADITGPSIPRLFGLPSGGLRGSDQGILPAVTKLGIKVVSTNLLVPSEDAAVIWRGPMIAATIQQFWRDVLWGNLDVLFVDLPPGTSDAALSVMQTLPVNGVVLVTTPQELAGMVVRKADSMLKQLKIPVLAVVENMSFYTCPDCGSEHEIFGPSHLTSLASAVETENLFRLPIDPQLNTAGDAGRIEEYSTPILLELIQSLGIYIFPEEIRGVSKPIV
ncbi:MAG: Mrp/NBP35 family ATP-binding protein [Chloroflexi bacterium]|nr:Mrp/NBP35 family ATP-binding protein [Chloroflexota bacterium]